MPKKNQKMKKANILLAIISLVFLLSCRTQKTGCDPSPKIKREIKFKGFMGGLQPKNLQVKVVGVLSRKPGKIALKCVSMQGDTVFVNYGYHSVSGRTLIRAGSRLTIHAYQSDTAGVWYCRKISLNY